MPKQGAKSNDEKKRIVDFEISFYENILKKQPNFIECMKVLAEHYTRSGRYQEGLSLDLRLAEALPSDATVAYNLACSYSLLGQIEKSLAALKKAIKLGFTDVSHIKNDPDLENIRKDKRFGVIIGLQTA